MILRILGLLLAASAWPSPGSSGERAPSDQFYDAAAHGDTERIARLLAAGARPDATALWLAAVGGHAGAVKALLAGGVAPDAPLESGARYPPKTSLLEAAAYGQTEVVRVLVQAGADLRTGRGANHETPLGAALSRLGKFETAASLIALGAPVDAEIARCHNREICEFLLTHGARTETADAYGRTALHNAVDDASVVALLLDAGANPNARARNGETPLMRAAAFCEPATISLLLAKGAQIDARDGRGKTALMDAVTPCEPNASIRFEPRSVELLLEAGADPDVADASGRSARTRAKAALARWSLVQPAAPAIAEINKLFDRHPGTARQTSSSDTDAVP